MVKRTFLFIAFLFLIACSSQDLGLGDLKEAHPDSFADPIEALSKEEQEKVGLPDEIPFEVASVKATTSEEQVEVIYESSNSEKVLVTTLFNPGNILQESELQIPLNSGAVAGVQKKEDYVYIEWYESEADVIYQIEYHGSEEERTENAMNIANSI
ncbi:hypothetical protein [Halobacillus litoralis]|uniref:hypothetical protein n=1 Tax=Halobacillus litoralis TaxID=45668 RepID=UPI0024928BBC|nr:hypothetical protein [Halobacillus litoralis]